MNDKPKFTPGPWGDYGSVDQTLFIMTEKDVDLRIAKVDCHFPEYNKANARLIAKAPEMYDRIKELTERLKSWMDIAETEDEREADYLAIRRADAVIAQIDESI